MTPSLKLLLDGFEFDGNLGTTIEEVKEFEKKVGRVLPDELREILILGNGVEFRNNHHGIILWSVEHILAFNEAHQVQKETPDFLAIGSTGGGENYTLDYQTTPPSVVLVPAIGFDYENAIPIASDFPSLFARLKNPVSLFEGVASGIRRLSYEESCRLIGEYGAGNKTPSRKSGVPQYDDEEPDVSFFRTEVAHERWERLTLPRTFFGRSKIRDSSFAWSDLTESNLCWNDFTNASFKGTLLQGADLRASTYQNCNFNQCDLSGADLRRGTFIKCTFHGARLTNAIIPRRLMFSSGMKTTHSNLVFLEGPMPNGG